jgi:hypothetical protein
MEEVRRRFMSGLAGRGGLNQSAPENAMETVGEKPVFHTAMHLMPRTGSGGIRHQLHQT